MSDSKKIVRKKNVVCDGGEGSLGHPRVFLKINDNNKIDCPYCGKLFIYDPNHESDNKTNI